MLSNMIRCIIPPKGFMVKLKTPSARILFWISFDDNDDKEIATRLLLNNSKLSRFLDPSMTKENSFSIVSALMFCLASSVSSPRTLVLAILTVEGFLR